MNKTEIQKQIQAAPSLEKLDEIFRTFLGKKGSITLELRGLSSLPESERRAKGITLNELRQSVEQMVKEKSRALKESQLLTIARKEWIDVSAPGLQYPHGHLHPLTRVAWQIEDIFISMGFAVATGPEIEDEWHNFDALNIPQNHPARDMWDTFWIKAKTRINADKDADQRGYNISEDSRQNLRRSALLLRTHTSPVQIRYMQTHNPPFRIIVPGKVFRHEATDATHNLQFFHVEGLMVGKDVSLANFKAVINEFFKRLLGPDTSIRLRPSFFPFVEPGFEIDVRCTNCQKANVKDCLVCHGRKWLEVLGAGMVHPKVFDAVRYNSEDTQGFAFGIGMDRIAMIKYHIDDIRLLYSGDMRFLGQF